ncbi:unnamed protein product, partial [Phaeothamnion confervicola]
QIVCPALVIATMIILRAFCDEYVSPTIAYYCGQTPPWYSAGDSTVSSSVAGYVELVSCMVQPTACNVSDYYTEGFANYHGEELYDRYGYVDSGSGYPLYGVTVGDTSGVYDEAEFASYSLSNPSLPFSTVVEKVSGNGAILAVAPGESDDVALLEAATELLAFLRYHAGVDEAYRDSLVLFSSEGDIETYVDADDYDDIGYGIGKVAFAVVLETGTDAVAAEWVYKIRANYTVVWEESEPTVACLYDDCGFTYTIPSTWSTTDDLSRPQSSSYFWGYTYSGWLAIQQQVDRFIFWKASGEQVEIEASLGMMPTSSFTTDNFFEYCEDYLGLFFVLAYLYHVSDGLRGLVVDKESRTKESLRMTGLTDGAYTAAWATALSLDHLVLVAVVTGITCARIFTYSAWWLVAALFLAFSAATVALVFMLAPFFDRSKTAAGAGPFVFLVAYLMYFMAYDDDDSRKSKLLVCLSAPACVSLGALIFSEYEEGQVGVSWSDISTEYYRLSVRDVFVMLLLDTAIYSLVAWYLGKVLPSEFGSHEKPWFFLQPSFWSCDWGNSGVGCCGGGGGRAGIPLELRTPMLRLPRGPPGGSTGIGVDSACIEEPGPALEHQVEVGRGLSLRRVRKVYGGGWCDGGGCGSGGGGGVEALRALTLDLYEGQINVLLGPNGAGKSTAVSVLCGLVTPTSGDALVNGYSLGGGPRHVRRARMSLGICPQYDLLYPSLTVEEHVLLYAVLKGLPAEQARRSAAHALAEVGLGRYAGRLASQLSGGERRRLCVATALVGDPRTLILDEPTAGVDPYSRRLLWSALQRAKRRRTVLITTHDMNEADVLADRVAVVSGGELRCVGSPLFLKRLFKVGYQLSIVLGPPRPAQSSPKADGDGARLSSAGGGGAGAGVGSGGWGTTRRSSTVKVQPLLRRESSNDSSDEGCGGDGGYGDGSDRWDKQQHKAAVHALVTALCPGAQLLHQEQPPSDGPLVAAAGAVVGGGDGGGGGISAGPRRPSMIEDD